MKKPANKAAYYKPRGQPYTPRGKPAGQTHRGNAAISASLPISLAEPAASPTVGRFEGQPKRLRERWDLRQSSLLPLLMTAAALAIMQQFPGPLETAAVPARLRSEANPIEGATRPIAQQTQQSYKNAELTPIALLPAGPLAATLDEPPSAIVSADAPSRAGEGAPENIQVSEVSHIGAVRKPRLCNVLEVNHAPDRSVSPEHFGAALAAAAEEQIRDLVIYDDEYRVIQYPGGDVSPLYGVCTDVVIRAYRALGVDLQKLVHESQVGSGDTNISHRRTIALGRFFTKAGASLPITDIAQDYMPGDIVIYRRPQNRGSNDHIAVVSNVTGPSGHPMIVHNRGFGPQLEDALFVDEITGHFRYFGTKAPAAAVSRSRPQR